MNLTDVTPQTTTRCTVCHMLNEATPTDRQILTAWFDDVSTNRMTRSEMRRCIVAGDGPSLSETAFGRHLRGHQ